MRSVLLFPANRATIQEGFKIATTVLDAAADFNERQTVSFGRSPHAQRLALETEKSSSFLRAGEIIAGESAISEQLW
jgi:hypothetical protein